LAQVLRHLLHSSSTIFHLSRLSLARGAHHLFQLCQQYCMHNRRRWLLWLTAKYHYQPILLTTPAKWCYHGHHGEPIHPERSPPLPLLVQSNYPSKQSSIKFHM
jgi:hypothetical protein